MDKRELTKKIVKYVVGYGTGIVINGIINSNVEPDRIDQKIAVGVASLAIGGVIAEAASDYTDRRIEELFDKFEEAKYNIESAKY